MGCTTVVEGIPWCCTETKLGSVWLAERAAGKIGRHNGYERSIWHNATRRLQYSFSGNERQLGGTVKSLYSGLAAAGVGRSWAIPRSRQGARADVHVCSARRGRPGVRPGAPSDRLSSRNRGYRRGIRGDKRSKASDYLSGARTYSPLLVATRISCGSAGWMAIACTKGAMSPANCCQVCPLSRLT